MRLSDKVCIVTGGGSGIGRAACLLFAREGGRVVVADRAIDRAQEVAAEIATLASHAALAIAVDVSVAKSVRAMVGEVVQRLGRIDVLVNNAGYSFKGNVVDSDEHDWNRLMSVNVGGVFLCCKYAIPVMRKQGGGVIVNTSSVVATVGLRDLAAYCASKGAISALTRAMALDHAAERIRVNCIAPGNTDTPILNTVFAAAPDPAALRRQMEQRHVLNRMATPDEIAHGMLYLACDESSFVTGSTLTVDGGWTAQ